MYGAEGELLLTDCTSLNRYSDFNSFKKDNSNYWINLKGEIYALEYMGQLKDGIKSKRKLHAVLITKSNNYLKITNMVVFIFSHSILVEE